MQNKLKKKKLNWEQLESKSKEMSSYSMKVGMFFIYLLFKSFNSCGIICMIILCVDNFSCLSDKAIESVEDVNKYIH